MQELLTTGQDNLAHAYLCVGDIESNRESIKKFLVDQLDIDVVGNPNLYSSSFTSMGISEARKLSEQQSKTSVGNTSRKIFIVSFTTITREAQNALLKTLEEPTEDTIIFLLTGSVESLLPTVLSRVQVLLSENQLVYTELVNEYLQSDFANREKIYNQFLGDTKKNIPANKSGASVFISEILVQVLQHKSLSDQSNIYRDIEEMKIYINDRSSSLKYIFEYISIRLPKID